MHLLREKNKNVNVGQQMSILPQNQKEWTNIVSGNVVPSLYFNLSICYD